MLKTLEELIAVIRQRKRSIIEESYTKKLLNWKIKKDIFAVTIDLNKSND